MTVDAAIAALPQALLPFSADWEDPTVEDIFVVAPGGYFVRRGPTTEYREAPALDALTVEAIGAYAGHLRGQYADADKPILDCEMPTGERLSVVLPPCTPAGRPSLALRRASEALPTLEELDEQGLWTLIRQRIGGADGAGELHARRRAEAQALLDAGDITAFFRYCIARRWSIGITGETGSGKTHDATAIVMDIPLQDRVVTVADTEEWARLPHRNRVSFLHAKGGAITAEMLIDAALRNGPRWLLVQEVRDGAAFAFLRALASGAPGITTWHARSARLAFDALSVMVRQHAAGARLPEETLRGMLRAFVDVVVHVERGASGAFQATDIMFGQDIPS